MVLVVLAEGRGPGALAGAVVVVGGERGRRLEPHPPRGQVPLPLNPIDRIGAGAGPGVGLPGAAEPAAAWVRASGMARQVIFTGVH